MAEKKNLPPFKEFMEQMYGVKLEGKRHSPEEWDEFWKKMDEASQARQQNPQDGPEDPSSKSQ